MIAGATPHDLRPESGVGWIGSLPEHWELGRAKWLFKEMSRPVRPVDEVVTCFRDGVVTLRKNRRLSGFTEALQEHGYQGIRKGDLIIHAMDAFAGAVGVSDSDGKGTPVYAVCRPMGDADPWFYAHVVREMSRSGWILALATGIRERSTDFRFDDFAGQVVPIPPADEQRAIVRFIAYADTRIGRYVAAKRRLIALLEEQQRVMEQRAVTRGLDAGATFRPAGVEWLPEVPEHWDLRRLRFVVRIGTGARDTADRMDDGPYPFYVRSQTVERIDTYSFDEEAVLTAGDGAGVAKVFHHHIGKGELHQRVYKFAQFKGVRGKFFFYYLRANLALEVLKLSAKATVDSLRLPMLKNFPVALPPLKEQDAIVEAIEQTAADSDRAIARARREIELLGEYRFRLVRDLVTGKLDVRGAVADLPDVEPSNPSPFSENDAGDEADAAEAVQGALT